MPTSTPRKLRKWLRSLPSWKERRLYFIVQKTIAVTRAPKRRSRNA